MECTFQKHFKHILKKQVSRLNFRRPYGDYYSESDEEESQRTKSLRDTKQRIESSDEEMLDESQVRIFTTKSTFK